MSLTLYEMYATPGIYAVIMTKLKCVEFFFVEVDEKGQCHQLKPQPGYKRDGILSREGWNKALRFEIHGPFHRI